MLTASRPPNAPATVAAEKNIACLIPNSLRLYQLSSTIAPPAVLGPVRHGERRAHTMKGNTLRPGITRPRTYRVAIALLSDARHQKRLTHRVTNTYP